MMLIGYITADFLIAFIGGLGLLHAVVYFDRYLMRRHGSAANAAYLARMYARRSFDFQRVYRKVWIKPNEVTMPALEPKMLTASPARLLLTAGKA